MTATEILSIKAQLVLDARRAPTRLRRQVNVATLVLALAVGALLLAARLAEGLL